MADVSTDGPLPEPRRVPRVYSWIRHHPWLTFWGVSIPLFLGSWFSANVGLSTPLLIAALLLSNMEAFALANHMDPHRICPQCTEIPSDPEAALTKERWKLRLAHRLMDAFLAVIARPFVFVHRRVYDRWGDDAAFKVSSTVFSVVLVVAGLAILFCVDIPVGGHDLPIGWAFIALILALIGSLTMVHNRLRIWCPFCDDDGGYDDHVETLTPDPDPSDAPMPDLVQA